MKLALSLASSLLLAAISAAPAIAQDTRNSGYIPDRSVLPMPLPPFEGVIGETDQESAEAWPNLPTPPNGAPNIIVIPLDDVGDGQTSALGGPVPTPELDALAAEGQYSLHAALCLYGKNRKGRNQAEVELDRSRPQNLEPWALTPTTSI